MGTATDMGMAMARPTRRSFSLPGTGARGGAGLAITGFIGLGAVALGYAAWSNAAANVYETSQPAFAARQLGARPEAALNIAMAGKGEGDFSGLAAPARAAIARQAISSQAFAVLGLTLDGTSKGNAEYFRMSDRLSRRTPLAQLWLLENAVNQGDIEGALDRYDVLASLSWRYWSLLFPVLDSASGDPAIQKGLAKRIAAGRPWVSGYFDQILGHSSSPQNLADTILLAGGLPVAVKLGLPREKFLAQLADNGQVDALRRLLLSDPGFDKSLLGGVAFTRASLDGSYTPIGWDTTGDSATSVTVSRDGDIPSVRISATGKEAGALRKLLYVTPGNYRFGYKLDVSRLNEDANTRWVAACASAPSAVLWSSGPLTKPVQGWGNIVIPQGCGAVMLSLLATGGDDVSAAEFEISNLSLSRG